MIRLMNTTILIECNASFGITSIEEYHNARSTMVTGQLGGRGEDIGFSVATHQRTQHLTQLHSYSRTLTRTERTRDRERDTHTQAHMHKTHLDEFGGIGMHEVGGGGGGRRLPWVLHCARRRHLTEHEVERCQVALDPAQ